MRLRLNYTTFAIGAVGVLLILYRYWDLPWTPGRIAGLVLLIPSVVLLGAARIQLGRAFSIGAKTDTLVTTGLYTRLRNPIYFFGTLTLAGAALWADRPWFLVGVGAVVPLQVYRSRNEARALRGRFGEVYDRYRQRTWF